MYSKSITSLSKALLFIKSLVESAFKYIRAFILGVEVDMIDLLDADIDILNWQNKVNRLYAKDGILLASRDPEVANQVRLVWEEGTKYERMILQSRLPTRLTMPFYRILDRLNKLKQETLAFSDYDRIRPSPFVLHIFGPSGVGKSTLMQFLLADVYDFKKKKFDPTSDLYVRNAVQGFWDGYKNQRIVVFDDFMQSQIDQDLSKGLVELITCKNNLAYPLPMASLEDKGTTRFTSEFIYVSSNKDIPTNYPCVHDMTAIRRRRDLVACARVKSQFASLIGVDKEKVQAYMNKYYEPRIVDGIPVEITFCRDIYEFHLYSTGCDSNPGSPTGEILSWDELVEKISNGWDDLRVREEHFEAEVHAGKPVRKKVVQEELTAQVDTESIITCLREMAAHPSKMVRLLIEDSYHKGCVQIEDYKDPLISKWNELCKNPIEALRFDDLIEYVREKAKSVDKYKMAASFLIGVGSIFAMWKLFSPKETYGVEYASGDHQTKHPKGRQLIQRPLYQPYRQENVRVKQKMDPKVEYGQGQDAGYLAHACSDPNGLDILRRSIMHAQLRIGLYDGVSWSWLGGIMLAGRCFICPSHLFYGAQNDHWYVLKKSSGAQVHKGYLRDCEIVPMYGRDLSIVILPKTMNCYPDIRRHISDGSASDLITNNLCLITLADTVDGMGHFMQDLREVESGDLIDYANGKDSQPVKITSHYKYRARLEYGDCGSLLYVFNKSCRRRIIGMHVAGADDRGIASILNIKEINECIGKRDIGISLDPSPCEEDVQYYAQYKVERTYTLSVEGLVPPRYQQRQPAKTDIRKSLLYDKVFEHTTLPSVLTPSPDIGNPLFREISKMDIQPVLVPQEQVDRALDDYLYYLRSLPSFGSRTDVLSQSVAINGDPTDDYIRSIDFSTSPGFPYVHFTGYKGGKHFLFEGEEGEKRPLPRLQTRIEYRTECAKKGITPITVFLDVLKDERRPIAKVLKGHTRLFSVGPLDLNILVRQYFGRFVSFLQYNCIDGECSVGIDPLGVHWKMILLQMSDRSLNCVMGDYTAYDKMLPYQLIITVFKCIQKFYGDDVLPCSDDARIREVLYLSIFNCYRLANRIMYRPLCGNPSGNPLTVIVNSMVNSLIMRLAYFSIYPIEMLPFSKVVCLKTFGDDLIMTVRDDRRDFNFNTIKEYLRSIGISFSSPTKDNKEMSDYCSLEEATYLKRSFRRVDDQVFAPLAWDSITEMVNWIRKCPDERSAITTNIDTVRRELFHYGKEIYDSTMRKILDVAVENGLHVTHVPFESLQLARKKQQLQNICGAPPEVEPRVALH
jgi:hypothetical protein